MTRSSPAPSPTYQAPGWLTRNVVNRAVARLTRLGVSVWGSRILEVQGRSSGQARTTPVNLLTVGGAQYLVSPRGTTQWVRNVRAADGHLALLLGRRREDRLATEITGAEAVPVLRAYLQRWKMEVGAFFETGADATDAELAAIVANHPVFGLAPALSAGRR
ncbi:MAG: nitroreductase/quinone reductase family protein [Actinomycetota bacterium]|nr:nitroreductase/quinone reductase family protein [Actinomycetota bacterium]